MLHAMPLTNTDLKSQLKELQKQAKGIISEMGALAKRRLGRLGSLEIDIIEAL